MSIPIIINPAIRVGAIYKPIAVIVKTVTADLRLAGVNVGICIITVISTRWGKVSIPIIINPAIRVVAVNKPIAIVIYAVGAVLRYRYKYYLDRGPSIRICAVS